MRLAIFGVGPVGTSVAQLAPEYGHTVTAFADSQSAVVDSDGVDVEAALTMEQSDGVVGNTEPGDAITGSYDVLVEASPTMFGDTEHSFDHLQAALERDRHVVLGNKGPIAEHYTDVRALERESEGKVLFGATVGGAMPVLSTIDDIGPGHITAVQGVLNGTTNFILSRMAAEGLDYEHVLVEAQDLGVAETDPSFSVEGTDTALNCVIIANALAQDEHEFTLDDVQIEGIKNIPSSALELAREDGRTIRLIGKVAGDEIRVAPRLIPENASLAVSGTRNVVQLETEHAGRLNVSGSGGSGPEIATAILGDVGRLN
jgi:homoserine dehydrogenase